MKTFSLILTVISFCVCFSSANEVQKAVLGFVQEYVCDHIDKFQLTDQEHPEMIAACHEMKRKNTVEDMMTSSQPAHQGHHPVVQTHAIIWYKNWVTCSVCKTASLTFYTLATESLYIKALEGWSWFLCSTQFSQSFCKYYVAEQITTLDVEIFPLMLSDNFICGYLFDMCTGSTATGEEYYVSVTTLEYETSTLSMENKPATTLDNLFLDNLYSKPKLSPDFKVLWISDIDIDLNYVYESSNNCPDASCCHAQNIPVNQLDLAPLYGHTNCNLPIDGYYKLIDTLNALNATADFSFNSILYGGSGSAVNPEQLTQTQVTNVHTNLIKYMREKNDYVGIYHTLGPHDMFPLNYELFQTTAKQRSSYPTVVPAVTWATEQAAAQAQLTNINTAVHPDGVSSDYPSKYSSISSNTAAQTSFLAGGYYSMRPVVYMQGYDGGSPPKAITAYPKNDLHLISINTNACHNRNFALMREKSDPGGQLAWLIATLTQIETDSHKAWIIGNVNPASKYCNSRWARRYNSIVNRFQAIIRSQFFGHESEEYFSLQFPQGGQSMNPFGVTFQGAKASSLGHNPQFKIIKMDYSNYMPQEINTYEFDLQAVNANPQAQPETLIKLIRSMPADLDSTTPTTSLRPTDLYAFISRLNITEKIAVDFNNKFCPSQEDKSSNMCRIKECGTICRHNMACKLGNASSIDIMACRKVGLQDVDYGLEYMISLLQNPWVTECTTNTGTYPCNKYSADTYTYWSH